MKDITMTFTQDEANALFTAMYVRVNDFKEQMRQAGIDGNTDRVLECAVQNWSMLLNRHR